MGTLEWALFCAWVSLLRLPARPAQALSTTQRVFFLSQLGRAGSLPAFLFALQPPLPSSLPSLAGWGARAAALPRECPHGWQGAATLLPSCLDPPLTPCQRRMEEYLGWAD